MDTSAPLNFVGISLGDEVPPEVVVSRCTRPHLKDHSLREFKFDFVLSKDPEFEGHSDMEGSFNSSCPSSSGAFDIGIA